MTLFIIGNGFDLSHNLKTSYLDFKNFISEEKPEFLEKIFEFYKYSFKRTYKNHYSEEMDVESLLWADFEKNMGSINYKELLNTNLELNLEYEDSFCDYDYEIQERYVDKNFEDVPEELLEILNQWILSIDTKLINKKTSFIIAGSKNLFLTFNYTDTLSTVYGIEENKICHIHGTTETSLIIGHNNLNEIEQLEKLKNDTFNIILGENNIFDYQEIIEKNDSVFEDNDYKIEQYKYEKIIYYYKKTLKNIKENIEENIDFFEDFFEVKEIIIIGHSLGEVDLPYFKEVLTRVKENTFWKVYYYKKDEKDIFKEILIKIGIDESNILMCPTEQFFNIKKT